LSEDQKVLFTRLPAEIKAKLDAKAAAEGVSQQALVNRMIERSLEDAIRDPSEAESIIDNAILCPPVPVDDVDMGTFDWNYVTELRDALATGHVFIEGLSGVGKSFEVRKLAKKWGQPVIMMTAGYGMGRETIEGQHFRAPGPD
jgi:AAA+ superfamily predicted ATPase